MDGAATLPYLLSLGLNASTHATPGIVLNFSQEFYVASPLISSSAGQNVVSVGRSLLQCEAVDEFKQAFEEAYASALTKFDSLEVYFANGMIVPSVCEMVAEEMQEDKDFLPALAAAEHKEEMQNLLRKAVGMAHGAWKKHGGAEAKTKAPKLKDNPLPWSSIDAYPEWVVNQIENYASAAPGDQADSRTALEYALLEKPLSAASIKYDGTCFGKLDTGELVGRKQILGKACDQYQQTSTDAAEPCNVAALRVALARILSREVGSVCVWGELMCNPGFYGYRERGLSAKWLCFGVVATLAGLEDNLENEKLRHVSQQLTQQGFAHSLTPAGKLRLLLCPALIKLLKDVVGCDVVSQEYRGFTHAAVVQEAAKALSEGDNEGLVLVFTRPDGQASLRKWKNSAEGGTSSRRHAQLLNGCHDLCLCLVAEGRLDARIAKMVATMQGVAGAVTSPLKKGRSKVLDAMKS